MKNAETPKTQRKARALLIALPLMFLKTRLMKGTGLYSFFRKEKASPEIQAIPAREPNTRSEGFITVLHTIMLLHVPIRVVGIRRTKTLSTVPSDPRYLKLSFLRTKSIIAPVISRGTPVAISARADQRHFIGVVVPLAKVNIWPCAWQLRNCGVMLIARANAIIAAPRTLFTVLLLLSNSLSNDK